jgi:hypothetical protein
LVAGESAAQILEAGGRAFENRMAEVAKGENT